MGGGKMKKLLLLILFTIPTIIFPQGTYVSVDNEVYPFLDRMKTIGKIENYYSESLPLTRKKVAELLLSLWDRRNELNSIDKTFLDYYLTQFGFEAFGSTNRYESLIGDPDLNLFSDREKFLFAYVKEKDFSVFAKSYLFIRANYSEEPLVNHTAKLGEIGGRIYGSFADAIGFEIDGSNGILKGDKAAALVEKSLRYNFKLFGGTESKFFDRAYGYISFEHPNIALKIGSDRQTIGYGLNKLILGDESPNFNYVSLCLSYKSFQFDYSHGWLLGSRYDIYDSLMGNINYINPKYFVHHRLSFSPFNNLRLGFGESVIYSRRNVDLAYLNPFNFYKSAEHSLQDRDNTLLYADFEYLPIPKLKLYSTLLIDDIDFEKMGTGWFGNKFAFNLGLDIVNPIENVPLHFNIEYARIEPYTYTHRILDNNYSNYRYPLGSSLQPNSDRISFIANFLPSPKLNIITSLTYERHGENYNLNWETINVGGDLNLGKRNSDDEYVKFLDGNLEQTLSIEIKCFYEFIRNIRLHGKLRYENIKTNENYNFLILSIGLISFI
jgi:hypothetical protein